jgi:hypothetical protein
MPMIRPNATVIDIAEGLTDPVSYVRGVLDNCRECVTERKADTVAGRDGMQHKIANLVQVRIGTSRRSVIPNYRIERGWITDGRSGQARVYRICDGRTHKRIMEWTDAVLNERWSEKTNSLAEIEVLWGQIALN